MSGSIVSPFPDKSFAEYRGEHLQNALSEQRQAVTEMEVMARAAGGLLESYPDEASRAAAYPGIVADLQRQGFARRAPSAYPGQQALTRLRAMGVPAATQYENGNVAGDRNALANQWGAGAAPTSATVAPPAGGGTQPIPTRGTGGPGASANMPPELFAVFQRVSQETGVPLELLVAQSRQESGFRVDATGGAGEIGLMQIHPNTAAQPGYGLQPVSLEALRDPYTNVSFGARYLKARAGQGADLNNPAHVATALRAYNGGGDPNYVANVTRYMPALAPTDPRTAVTTYDPNAPPEAPAGGPGRVQVATARPTTATDGTPAPVPGATPASATVPPAEAQPPFTPPARPPAVTSTGLTPQQQAEVQQRFGMARTREQLAQVDTIARGYAQQNLQQRLKYQDDLRAYESKVEEWGRNQRSEGRQAAQLAISERNDARQALEQNDPMMGNTEGMRYGRILRDNKDAVLDGTATKKQRDDYALAERYFTKEGPQQWLPDPQNPNRMIFTSTPGKMPEGFPPSTHKPGDPIVKRELPSKRADETPAQADYRKAVVQATPLLEALDEFLDEAGKATTGDYVTAAAGGSNSLTNAWGLAGSLAKGDVLLQLGVLNGGDMALIRQILTDPSSWKTFLTDLNTTRTQVARMKRLINSGLDTRKRFADPGGGGGDTGEKPKERLKVQDGKLVPK